MRKCNPNNTEEIIRLTQDLIRFKSTHSNPREIKQCVEFIEKYLNKHHVNYKRLVYGNTPSVLILPHLQTGFAPVLLMSHIDVVDAPADLFNPSIQDAKLYGRGSLDDKYAVALSLVLVTKHLQQLQQQNKNQADLPFGVLITSDEETGGFNGAKKLLQQIKTDFCIVLDGGNIGKIVVKEKGRVRMKLVSRIKANRDLHSRPEENAVDNMIEDYIKLKTFFVKSAPEHRHRSVDFRNIRLEKSLQHVPKYAEAFLDIRYTENDNMEGLLDWMQRELQGEVVVECIEPLFPEGESSYLNLLLEIAEQARIGFEDGSNDARFLPINGINGIIYGADGNQSQHSLTEHVDIESICKLHDILDAFVIRSKELKPIPCNYRPIYR